MPGPAAAVPGPFLGAKKERRPRRRPRLNLSNNPSPARGPFPAENALFPAEIAGFLMPSRPFPVYPGFLKYVVPVQKVWNMVYAG